MAVMRSRSGITFKSFPCSKICTPAKSSLGTTQTYRQVRHDVRFAGLSGCAADLCRGQFMTISDIESDRETSTEFDLFQSAQRYR